MTNAIHIAERVLNRPLMVHPDKLPLIMSVLEGRIPLGDISDLTAIAKANAEQLPEGAQATLFGPAPNASRFVGSSTDEDPVTGRRVSLPYRRTREGTAVIPVIGTLVNRGAWVGSYSGETSYEGLKFQIAHAADDPRTNAILLDIDSPGGEAVGAFEVTEAVRRASTKKPVTAVVNGMAASAAYAIAVGASRIVTTATGVSGSIGVVMLHGDFSERMKMEGIKPTFIFAGAHKVDGNPFEPLSGQVKSDLQAEIDAYYSLFLKSVATGRGTRLTENAARATQARTYIGAAAVAAGLADSEGTFESALADLDRAHSSVPNAVKSSEAGERAATAPTPAPTSSLSVPKLAPVSAVASFNHVPGRKLAATAVADAPEVVAERINGTRPSAAAEQALVDHGWNDVIGKINRQMKGGR